MLGGKLLHGSIVHFDPPHPSTFSVPCTASACPLNAERSGGTVTAALWQHPRGSTGCSDAPQCRVVGPCWTVDPAPSSGSLCSPHRLAVSLGSGRMDLRFPDEWYQTPIPYAKGSLDSSRLCIWCASRRTGTEPSAKSQSLRCRFC